MSDICYLVKVMFSLRRNRAFLVKILLLTPLTWLCVVLYMNSSTKIIQQQQQGHQEQIVYVNDNNKIPVEDNVIAQEQIEVKGPPLKDNLLRKKKPTPSGLLCPLVRNYKMTSIFYNSCCVMFQVEIVEVAIRVIKW